MILNVANHIISVNCNFIYHFIVNGQFGSLFLVIFVKHVMSVNDQFINDRIKQLIVKWNMRVDLVIGTAMFQLILVGNVNKVLIVILHDGCNVHSFFGSLFHPGIIYVFLLCKSCFLSHVLDLAIVCQRLFPGCIIQDFILD